MRIHARDLLHAVRFLGFWLALSSVAGLLAGSASALFLWLLDRATNARFDHPWLLYLLPVAGMLVVGLYQWLGRDVDAGNNLIVDQIHEPGGGMAHPNGTVDPAHPPAGVPLRMAPLVLVGTVLTHLFGGSAGREGTAVQMSGSLAAMIGRVFRLRPDATRTLLTAGVAAGFGAVFGTPLAGAIFAMEVLAIGRMHYDALIPCLIASVAGDVTCQAWGIHHTAYYLPSLQNSDAFAMLSPSVLGKVALAAIAFGLVGLLFAEMTHRLSTLYKRFVPWPIARPVIGGAIVIALTHLLGTRDYLGLGVLADPHHPNGVTIVSAFAPGGATALSWWWKIVFTAVTLAAGFKGGEVTPLFYIGATFGNMLGWLMGAPVDLFAALGFVAVFAGATNTPIACAVMGIELFAGGVVRGASGPLVIYLATACFIAYLFSGHSGIYLSQRIARPKLAIRGEDRGSTVRRARSSQLP